MVDLVTFPSQIPNFDYGGYYEDELALWLKSNGLWERWCKAAMGSTAGIQENRIIVHKVDVDCFLAGRRLPD